MDRRTSYRVKFRPDACDRWVAQYRRWWSPFWVTIARCVCHGVEFSLYLPVWFNSSDEAEAWCRKDAEADALLDMKKRQHRKIINLGRLP